VLPLASAVEWGDVVEVLWVSAAAGIGVTLLFSLALLGATRAVDYRRNGSMAGAVGYAALMTVAGAGVGAAVVFALIVMTQKT
jgi:hypothetical protein